MTFKGSNVAVDSAGTITMTAGGATICFDKTGKATFDSPTGINLVCGSSSLTILPGGVAIASPNVTAAAGAGSVMALGEAIAAMNSKTVTIEADGVCSIKGKSALKLQEAEAVKSKGLGGGKGASSAQTEQRTAGSPSLRAANSPTTALNTRMPDEAPVEEYATPVVGVSKTKAASEQLRPVPCGHPAYPDIAQKTKTITCASGAFEWTGKFDIRLTERALEIGVRIKLVNRLGPKPSTAGGPLPPVGPPLSLAEKAAMKADIEGKLSNKRLFHRAQCTQGDGCDCPKNQGCCKIRVRIFVDFVESGQHHEVNLFQGAGRANSGNWTRVKTRDNSYAHETGHLLGFYDEYFQGAVGQAPRWKLQSDVIMSTGLRVPPEYYWDFRDWLKKNCANEDWTVLPP